MLFGKYTIYCKILDFKFSSKFNEKTNEFSRLSPRDFSASNGVVQDILAVQERMVSHAIRAMTVITDTLIAGMTGASGMTGTPGETGPPGTEVSIPGATVHDIATFTGTGSIQDSKGASLTSAGVLNLATSGAQIRFDSNPVFQIGGNDNIAIGIDAVLVPVSTAIGHSALSTAGAGAENNTAVGAHALESTTSGPRNTAVGTQAGSSLTATR